MSQSPNVMLSMLAQIEPVLDTIAELGFVHIQNNTIQYSIQPKLHIYSNNLRNFELDRWNVTMQYLTDYSFYHSDFDGSYFLCLYDGWREMTEPAEPSQRIHIPWNSYSDDYKETYLLGVGSVGEPRFYSHLTHITYIDLPLPVIAYNRHWNDSNVLLIPDPEFLQTGFESFTHEVSRSDVSYEQKSSQIIWRGARHVNEGYIYTTEGYEQDLALLKRNKIHPRDLACAISQSGGRLVPDVAVFFNASFEYLPVAEMLTHKYLLDLDGMVSAWSGLYWKLYSNSVVFKLRSHWEQWYYRDMKPFHHFIPLANLSPAEIQKAFDWCEILYPKRCKQIAEQSSVFVQQLTYDFAVKNYTIH